jgi:hypothetical protein
MYSNNVGHNKLNNENDEETQNARDKNSAPGACLHPPTTEMPGNETPQITIHRIPTQICTTHHSEKPQKIRDNHDHATAKNPRSHNQHPPYHLAKSLPAPPPQLEPTQKKNTPSPAHACHHRPTHNARAPLVGSKEPQTFFLFFGFFNTTSGRDTA